MSKEIIINSDQKQTRIAIVENDKLAELFIETKEVERTIGNLFLGRVRRIMPSIQAAFVDIGQKQDAFLHFSDLVDNIPDWLKFVQEKEPKIGSFKAEFARQPIKGRRGSGRGSGSGSSDDSENSDYDIETIDDQKSSRGKRSTDDINPVNYLKRDSPILVRISKEPIASKGSRITTDISLAGRFLVLVPLAGYVAVSKKIVSFKERRRLKALAKSLVPDGFGVIVRTVAEGRNAKALDTDLRLLIQKWQKVEELLAEKPELPCEIHEDVNMASSIIRDFFSEDFDRIVIDSDRLYRNIKGYIQAVAPKMASRVHAHKDSKPLFEAMKIEQAVEQAFSSRVDMPSGGYLFIEQTEAMHVVDVNSGRAGRGLSQEENSTRVNLEAATLIAEQVRLRDLGGILVVDFIDMRQQKNRRKVYDHLRREFRKDRAVTKVLQMSDFGLIQITRQRLRPSINASFSIDDSTPALDSSRSKLKTPVAERPAYETVEPADFVRKINDWLDGMREAKSKGPVKLTVHPFTGAFLTRGFLSQVFRWFLKHRIRVHIELDEHIDPLSFRFVDMHTGKTISRRPDGADAQKDSDSKRSLKAGSKPASKKSRERDGGKSKSASSDSRKRGNGRSKPATEKEGSESTSSKTSGRSRGTQQRSGTASRNTRRGERSGEKREVKTRDSKTRDTKTRDTKTRDTKTRDTTSRDEKSRTSRSRGSENRSEETRPSRSESARNRPSRSTRTPRTENREDAGRRDDVSSAASKASAAAILPLENDMPQNLPAGDGESKPISTESTRDTKTPRRDDRRRGSVKSAERDVSVTEPTAEPAAESAKSTKEEPRRTREKSREIPVTEPVKPKPKGHIYNIDLRSGKGNL